MYSSIATLRLGGSSDIIHRGWLGEGGFESFMVLAEGCMEQIVNGIWGLPLSCTAREFFGYFEDMVLYSGSIRFQSQCKGLKCGVDVQSTSLAAGI